MQGLLMNFGDGARVIYNARGAPVMIGVGDSVPAELTDSGAAQIRKHMATDTLMLVPLGGEGSDMPAGLLDLMTLLRDVDTVAYDDLVMRAHAVVGADNMELRPSRNQVRIRLRDIAAAYAHGDVPVTQRPVTTANLKKLQDTIDAKAIADAAASAANAGDDYEALTLALGYDGDDKRPNGGANAADPTLTPAPAGQVSMQARPIVDTGMPDLGPAYAPPFNDGLDDEDTRELSDETIDEIVEEAQSPLPGERPSRERIERKAKRPAAKARVKARSKAPTKKARVRV